MCNYHYVQRVEGVERYMPPIKVKQIEISMSFRSLSNMIIVHNYQYGASNYN
jgi:hypothetical protein